MPDIPVVQSLAECGVQPDGYTITYDNDLQGSVIVFSAASGASVENIECIWNATRLEFVQFANIDLQTAYDAVGQAYYDTHLKGQVIDSARQRLAERGLLETLPQSGQFQSRKAFGVAIEQHCGFEPNSILQVSGDTFTVWPQVEVPQPSTAEFAKFSCLLASLTLANEADGHLKIGFVGNEKFRESEGQ